MASLGSVRDVGVGPARRDRTRLVMAAALLCAVALAALVVVVEATGRTTAPDRSVQHILLMHRVGWATRTLRVYTWLGSSVVLIPMVAAAAIWRVARGRAAGPRLDPASA